ncbi:MAG: hypothetical protein ABH872_04120 [Candidatus Omnitrophota bacterium]
MFDKDKLIYFLTGMIAGIFTAFLFLGGMFAVYKVGKKVANFASRNRSKPNDVRTAGKSKHSSDTKGKSADFNLSFEKEGDLEFFSYNDGLYVEKSKEFATDGSYSLLAEYPGGAKYPGLFWEVYKKDKCLNFQGANEFSFDVYNNSEAQAHLTVKLKSSSQYPKKVFQRNIALEPQKAKKVSISIEDMNNQLDAGEISYINLFIPTPNEDIVLYFDNIRTN